MSKCPACDKYTLDFDEYFGRFRCFDPHCNWMPSSTTEMELKRLDASEEPVELHGDELDSLQPRVAAYYDPVNDAIVVDFGRGESSFDLPDPDGYMIWKVGHDSGSVNGFVLVGAKKLGIYEIQVDIAARKQAIEQKTKALPEVLRSRYAIRTLIDSVSVTATVNRPTHGPSHGRTTNTTIMDAIRSSFREKILTNM